MKRTVTLAVVAALTTLGPAAWAAGHDPEPNVSQSECEEGGGRAGKNADGRLECFGGRHDGAPIIGF